MLVLSRKLGEKIRIGDSIEITVTSIERGKIRLGIEAPRDILIIRSELIAGGAPPVAGDDVPRPVAKVPGSGNA